MRRIDSAGNSVVERLAVTEGVQVTLASNVYEVNHDQSTFSNAVSYTTQVI